MTLKERKELKSLADTWRKSAKWYRGESGGAPFVVNEPIDLAQRALKADTLTDCAKTV